MRLVKTGADGEKQCVDVVTINRPDDLGDIANLGLTLAEGKLLLAGLQQEIVAAQAKGHAVRRPHYKPSSSRVTPISRFVRCVLARLPILFGRFDCTGSSPKVVPSVYVEWRSINVPRPAVEVSAFVSTSSKRVGLSLLV